MGVPYAKRDWDTSGNEVTKEDFKRIENGVEANDLEIANQKNATIPGTLAQQINVLNDKVLWKTSDWKTATDLPSAYQSDSTSIFTTSVAWAIDGVTLPSYTVVKTTCDNSNVTKQEFFRTGTVLYYRLSNGSNAWGQLQQIATTTKTEVLCTEQNGFTISKQTSYQINNIVYYCVRFSGTLQANTVATVAKMPNSKYNTSNSVSGCFSGVSGANADGVGMARFTSTGNIDVKCNVAISDFTVSGVIVL